MNSRAFLICVPMVAVVLGAAGTDGSGAAVVALTPYSLPDKTASVALPSGWNVVQTGVAFIRAQGPNGELALFGLVVPARDAPTAVNAATGITQPYAAELKDKFTQSLGWVLERSGKPGVPIDIRSESDFKAPPAFGKCATYTMLLGVNAQIAAEADFCSLPKGKSGNYRNFFKIVGLGAAHAKAQRATLEAVLASYKLNLTAIKQAAQQRGAMSGGASGGAPQNPAAALVGMQQQQMAWQLANAQANAIQASTGQMMRDSMNSANNFDHDLRGDTAVYGSNSSQPLFWIGN